jgi:hypothetical protein
MLEVMRAAFNLSPAQEPPASSAVETQTTATAEEPVAAGNPKGRS